MLFLVSAFFRIIFRFYVFFLDIWVLRDPTFSAKKTKKTKRKTLPKDSARQIKHVYISSGSNSKNWRGRLDLCAVKCNNHGLAS